MVSLTIAGNLNKGYEAFIYKSCKLINAGINRGFNGNDSSMKKPKVYIASPYTNGNKEDNVRVQHDAFRDIIGLGAIPFAPLFGHYHHEIHPMDYSDWMEWDLMWVESCDVLLRLPGDSPGAEIEVGHAQDKGIPVVWSMDGLIDYLDGNERG